MENKLYSDRIILKTVLQEALTEIRHDHRLRLLGALEGIMIMNGFWVPGQNMKFRRVTELKKNFFGRTRVVTRSQTYTEHVLDEAKRCLQIDKY